MPAKPPANEYPKQEDASAGRDESFPISRIPNAFHGIINLSRTCSDAKARGHTIKIASWNINRRASLTAAQLAVTTRLLRDYDLIVFQEVARTSGTRTVQQIRTALNTATSNAFAEPHVSDATGAGNEAERYAMIWKESVLEKVSGTSNSLTTGLNMARQPFYAHFKVKDPAVSRWPGKQPFDFVAFVVHTQPARPGEFAEIARGASSVATSVDEPDVIIMGDINAGPSGNASDPFERAFSNRFPIIGGSVSTMVPTENPNSRAAAVNDNIIFGAPTVPDYAGQSGVDSFDTSMTIRQARAITDHRIVWATFCKDNDDDR